MASLNLVPTSPGLRRYAYANLLNTVGIGLYLAGSALFFTRGIGLSAGQVATGLGIGTGVGLVLMMPLGRLADRYGAKPVYVGLLITQASSMAAFTMIDSFSAFLGVAVVSGIAESGVSGTAGALIYSISKPEERVVGRAQLRTSTNLGLGCGSLLAAGALALGTKAGYTVLIAGNSVMFVVAAVLVARIPVTEQLATPQARPKSALSLFAPLRDLGYMAVAAANALLSLHVTVLAFAVPLWIANHTRAPLWSVSLVLLVNTSLVVLFQVRVSSRANTVSTAARSSRLAGFVLAASCAVMVCTSQVSAVAAVVLLLMWAGLLTLGELFQSAGEFCFSFELAPDDAQGVYQSAFALAPGVVRAVAPAALTFLVLQQGQLGWAALAGVFALGGLAIAAAAEWAQRRQSAVPAEHTDPKPQTTSAH
ncbi:MFS transporter [Streptomyces sp. NPDC090053]|uniref:MFS transporter n=1 Tax=Streptomyces sp. NPDC090053 TaxID=3365932 RepID=UPI003826C6D6